jgi:uncharacterized coiled-coil protein SlyX
MHTSYLEWAIIVFITGGIAYSIWRGGAANPETTGALGRKISKLEVRVGAVDTQVSALGEKVGHLEGQMADLESSAAKGDDIKRLENTVTELRSKVATLAEGLAAQQAHIEHTRRQVDLLYNFIVERGMSK